MMSEFIKRVKELMERDHISQKELAKLSGISESSISRYLSGSKEPRMDILTNISKVFNVTTSYLLGEIENAPQFFDAYEETLAVVMRNKKKLDDQQKAELIKVLFGGK